MASTTLPTRSNTADNDDLIPDEDSSEATKLFLERLQAWKHACGYLEDYITATEKLAATDSKEYEKILKTVNNPLREAHHFDSGPGGIAGLFESLRTNTQGLSNSSADTAKTLKASVLPIFERLHAEIKNKSKEVNKSAGKGAKSVDKARTATQKHVELLGQHSATFDTNLSGVKAAEDPYVTHRQVYHRLHKQVVEENSNRDDMLAVQNNFSQFETHVLQTFQQGLAQFDQVLATHATQARTHYSTIVGTSQQIPPQHEWNGFLKRNSNTLIDPSAPKRTVESIGFANQEHQATKPLIAGALERKGKVFKRYESAYWVVTPSKYMHEYKTDDDFAKDPTPENSLYLPDCLVGAVEENRFNVRGKSTGMLATTKEYSFKAHTAEIAKQWRDVIASVAGVSNNDAPDSVPSSPVAAQTESTPIATHVAPAATATPVATTGTVPVATHATPVATTGTVPATTEPASAPLAAATTAAAPTHPTTGV